MILTMTVSTSLTVILILNEVILALETNNQVCYVNTMLRVALAIRL